MAEITIHTVDSLGEMELPFADGGVHAGFPSPAQDLVENGIDLNRDLVAHPESTFYARVVGESMIDANVLPGDILVIDRSLTAVDGSMALCVLNGEFTVKNLEIHSDGIVLRPANAEYKPIRIGECEQFEVWGVVTYVIHKVGRG